MCELALVDFIFEFLMAAFLDSPNVLRDVILSYKVNDSGVVL